MSRHQPEHNVMVCVYPKRSLLTFPLISLASKCHLLHFSLFLAPTLSFWFLLGSLIVLSGTRRRGNRASGFKWICSETHFFLWFALPRRSLLLKVIEKLLKQLLFSVNQAVKSALVKVSTWTFQHIRLNRSIYMNRGCSIQYWNDFFSSALPIDLDQSILITVLKGMSQCHLYLGSAWHAGLSGSVLQRKRRRLQVCSHCVIACVCCSPDAFVYSL